MLKVNKIIAQVDSLKSVSHVCEKVLEVTSNPKSSASDLVKVIKFDQAITANLLRICNSTYFGLRKKISSVKQAVAYLGMERVASMVVMGSSAENFRQPTAGYNLGEKDLWRYSVSSALIAQGLAERKGLAEVAGIFTAALLKDIGKLILGTYVEESLSVIMEKVQQAEMSFLDAEREVLGIDHAQLGAKAAEKWHFPQLMVDRIRYHHSPLEAGIDDLSVPIIYLGDCICMMMGIGVGADGLAYRHYQDVMELLNFTERDMEKAMAGFQTKLADIENLLILADRGV
jgi:putative nucleotidyltransferase with HDIG domain